MREPFGAEEVCPFPAGREGDKEADPWEVGKPGPTFFGLESLFFEFDTLLPLLFRCNGGTHGGVDVVLLGHGTL
jgi:hypothetical protein